MACLRGALECRRVAPVGRRRVRARARRAEARAVVDRQPTWCGSCREMDRTTYADPSIATLDQQALRSRPGGRRSTPGHQRALRSRRMADDRVSHARRRPARRRHVRAARPDGVSARPCRRCFRGAPAMFRDESSPAAPGPRAGDALPIADLTAAVFGAFDEEHGGFGVAPKFPLVAPLHLALELSCATVTNRRPGRSPRPRSTRWAGAVCTTTSTAASSALRGDPRLAAAAVGEDARGQRRAAAPLSRCRIDAGARALQRTRRRRAAIRPDLARRSGRRRLVGLAAGGCGLLRRGLHRRPTAALPRHRSARSCTPIRMPRWFRPRCTPHACSTTTACAISHSSRSSASCWPATNRAPVSRITYDGQHVGVRGLLARPVRHGVRKPRRLRS